MDFQLTEEHLQVREMARKFAQNVLKPGVIERDRDMIHPTEFLKQMGELGFDLQIHTIGSFEKLTGEGVTFVNTDFVHIIEEVLPRQFGGESTDYQIVEEEDSTGITHLNLLVSPRVRDVDEQSVVQVFLRHLLHSDETPGSWARSGSQMWSHVGTVRVKREYPIPTKRAKILPFHVVRNLEKMKASKDS